MKKLIRRLTRLELILIYLVIIAGSIVRMTGSGMGCPDWPKCFGYLIPPSERSQLEWQAEREFKKGQIIIVDESLKVANGNFITGRSFDPVNWDNYTKHDYAHFNPSHTWTEYINRLIGAAAGLPMIILLILGGLVVRQNWRHFVLAALGLFLLAFEAWLGKLVVDGNLIPGSITIHMMGALGIVAVLLVLLGINSDFRNIKYDRNFRNLLLLAMLLSVLQIILGTQVREQVDYLNKAAIARDQWIAALDWTFYLHRSFSILLLALNGWLWWQNRRHQLGFREMNAILAIVLLEILAGVILNYAAMPAFAQPLHLLLATLLFGFQMYALVRLALAGKVQLIRVK